MNFLPGWNHGLIGADSAPTPTLSFIVAPSADTVNRTTYSFSSVSLGVADSTRRIIVGCFHTNTTDTPRTVSSVSIAGSSGTIHVQGTQTSAGIGCALTSRLVATGTTGTISFTLSGSASWGAIAVWRMVNELNSTPNDTASDNTLSSGAADLNLDIPAAGVALAILSAGSSAPTGVNTSGVDEDFQAGTIETNFFIGGGSLDQMSEETNRAIQASIVGGVGPLGIGVSLSWR